MATERNDSPSIGELLGELSRQLSLLIRSEIALIRLEISNAIAQIGISAVMFVVAGLFAFTAYLFFLMMLHSLFVQLVGPWLGELIVTAILLATAGTIAWMGARRLDRWKASGAGSDSVEKAANSGDTDAKPQPEGTSNVG